MEDGWVPLAAMQSAVPAVVAAMQSTPIVKTEVVGANVAGTCCKIRLSMHPGRVKRMGSLMIKIL